MPLTAEQISRVRDVLSQHSDWSDVKVAKAIGWTGGRSAVIHAIRKVQQNLDPGEILPDDYESESPDELDINADSMPGQSSSFNWRECFEYAKLGQKLINDCGGPGYEGIIELPETSALVLSADWHFGSSATNYDELLSHFDLCVKTPNCYTFPLGDVYDNFIGFKNVKPVIEQVVPPQLQRRTVLAMLEEMTKSGTLKGFLIANHDSFEEKTLGESVLALLGQGKVPLYQGRPRITLKVGEQTYKLALFHKSRFNSVNTPLFSCLMEHQRYFPDADLVAGAHIHNPAVSVQFHDGREWVAVRSGSFKGPDSFSMSMWGPGILRVPTVVFHADKHKMTPFLDMQDALRYMEGSKAA